MPEEEQAEQEPAIPFDWPHTSLYFAARTLYPDLLSEIAPQAPEQEPKNWPTLPIRREAPTPDEPNARDSHFAGFAKMLVEEIERYVDADGWVSRFGYVDGVYQEVLPPLETLIARRAFDLVAHAFNDLFKHGELTEDVRGQGAFFAECSPDMTEWPDMHIESE